MLIKNSPIGAVKSGPEDRLQEGEFIVYPSTFTRKADSYGDVVAKGAFTDTIADWAKSGNTMPGLYGHRMDDPDFFVASALEMGEDDHGWWVKGAFDLESPKGAQVYRLVKGRRLNQLSFAYDVLEEGRAEGDDGEPVNELRKLRVHEFSFVPVGANQDTSVLAVKATAASLNVSMLQKDDISSLREAQETLGTVIKALEGDDQENEASGDAEAKSGASDEEPSGAKSSVPDEEPKSSPSVNSFLATISIAERSLG